MTRKFRFEGEDVAADIRERCGYEGDLAEIYAGTQGQQVHKWHHYIPLYDRYFGRFRGTGVRFLEIGVARGGSLQMWRSYLGPEAILYGIDIDEKCAEFDDLHGQVRIGSQDDPDFLARVVDEMGGVDVVLDDGSHRMSHIEASLRALFPRLAEGGVYMIEDLHAAYWPGFQGGHAAEANFFNTLRRIIDDMHEHYHHQGVQVPELAGSVAGLHVHDSLAVIDKGAAVRPVHSRVG